MKRSSLLLFAWALLFCFSIAPNTTLFAQKSASQEEKNVMAVIAQLFDGMRAGDSSQVRAVFMPNTQMQTVMTNNGLTEIRTQGVDRFIMAVGTPHEQVWDERLYETGIKIDGDLAVVWTDYRFYLGGNFSHCGVNVFQLIKSAKGWKIFQLCDTRRKDDCGEEPKMKKQKGKQVSGQY